MSSIDWIAERTESGEAMARIAAVLGDDSGPDAQDWAVEAARPERFESLVDAYAHGSWSDDEKFALASLIFACLDERMYTEVPASPRYLEDFICLMVRDVVIVAPRVGYWAMSHEDELDNAFRVTPIAREIQDRANARNCDE